MFDHDPLTWLYPPIQPFREGRLRVSDVHELYFEESGNPNGKPVVFLHGGPGGGTDARQRCFFNPKKYRIVLFDQRGCGKSTPHANLVDNTTWHLVSDMEKLREHLKIDKWQVFGGSWGSTLALAYAEKHPERVTELVLRGIYLCRPKDIAWLYQTGAETLFPDAWEKYVEVIPESERDDMVEAYYRRLCSDDPKVREQAGIAWSVWEGTTSKLLPSPDFTAKYANPKFADAFARIECHYFRPGDAFPAFFPTDNYLIEHAGALRKIPGVIVHGRYDIVCPFYQAWDLHKAWPEAELFVIPEAGHSPTEPPIARALVAATDRFSERPF